MKSEKIKNFEHLIELLRITLIELIEENIRLKDQIKQIKLRTYLSDRRCSE